MGRFEPSRWALLPLAAILFACQGKPAGSPVPAHPTSTRPAPTVALPPATPTPQAVAPTSSSPAACLEEPDRWSLIPIESGGKPVSPPSQRIDPPCVYEALARDLARTLIPAPDALIPSVADRTLSVPWFWAPGTEIPQTQVRPDRPGDFVAFYDARGRKIDEFFLPYTAVATGDPDFPVLVYIYDDKPQEAWGTLHREGEEDLWVRYEIQGGEVVRSVIVMVYDAQARRWVPGAYPRNAPTPRAVHAVPAGSAEQLAGLFGLPLWRRGELLARAGLKDIFPDSVNPAALKPAATFVVSPEGMERR